MSIRNCPGRPFEKFIRFGINDPADGFWKRVNTEILDLNTWTHYVYTVWFEGNEVYMNVYVNGVFATDNVKVGKSDSPPYNDGERDKIIFGAKVVDGDYQSPYFGNCILDQGLI